MTRKEAAEILDQELEGELTVLAWMRDNGEDDIDQSRAQAFQLAISALNPWKRLSEEKPTKEGTYWIFNKVYGDAPDLSVVKAWWDGHRFMVGSYGTHVTHWREIEGPEE